MVGEMSAAVNARVGAVAGGQVRLKSFDHDAVSASTWTLFCAAAKQSLIDNQTNKNKRKTLRRSQRTALGDSSAQPAKVVLNEGLVAGWWCNSGPVHRRFVLRSAVELVQTAPVRGHL